MAEVEGSRQTATPSVVEFRGSLYEACGESGAVSRYAEQRSASRRKWALAGSAVAFSMLLGVVLLTGPSGPWGDSVLALKKLRVMQLDSEDKSVKFFNLADDPQVTTKDVDWAYEGSAGPSNWGLLSTKWGECGTGKFQSPININRANVKEFDMAPLKWKGFETGSEEGAQRGKEFYDGKTIALGDLDGPQVSSLCACCTMSGFHSGVWQIEVLGFSRYLKDLPLSAVIKNHFKLKEIRIHTPSEHSIDGKRCARSFLEECVQHS